MKQPLLLLSNLSMPPYIHTPNNSRKKALVERMTTEGSGSNAGSERIRDRAAAIAALKRRGGSNKDR